MPQQLFVFIQLEFPWALGPADGRYLIRNSADREPERVVVLSTLQAGHQPIAGSITGQRRRSPLGRLHMRARPVPPGPEPAAVATTRVTVIDPISLAAENQARAWLAELDRDREVGAAVAVINRVIHSHRIAAADPYVHEVSPAQALVIRAGWGEGEQVADGRWLHARALPWTGGHGSGHGPARSRRSPRRDRSWALRPQERLAALLGARSPALLCEELALRARHDLDHGRLAHAALELERAFALAVPELHAERRQDLAIRIAELEQLRPGVQAQAQATLPGDDGGDGAAGTAATAPVDGLDEDVLSHALGRLEAALRARTAAGV
ncbi:MAG: hypothetical protein ABSG93_02845 [Solirubrobacteraceae bacterium]|jgi:hypothetical protein